MINMLDQDAHRLPALWLRGTVFWLVQSVRRRREEDREHYMPLDSLSLRKSCPAKATRENRGNQGPYQALPNHELYIYIYTQIIIYSWSLFIYFCFGTSSPHQYFFWFTLPDDPQAEASHLTPLMPRSSLLKIQTWGRVDALSERLMKWDDMGVSINGGTPKHDGLFHGKSHLEMDDLGVPPFEEPPYGCQQAIHIIFRMNIQRNLPGQQQVEEQCTSMDDSSPRFSMVFHSNCHFGGMV